MGNDFGKIKMKLWFLLSAHYLLLLYIYTYSFVNNLHLCESYRIDKISILSIQKRHHSINNVDGVIVLQSLASHLIIGYSLYFKKLHGQIDRQTTMEKYVSPSKVGVN